MSPRILAVLCDPVIHLLIFLILGLFFKKSRVRFLVVALAEVILIFYSTIPLVLLGNLEARVSAAELNETHPAIYLGGDCILENLGTGRLTSRGCALRAIETIRDTAKNKFAKLVLSGYTDPDVLLTHKAEMLSIQDLARLMTPSLVTVPEMGSRNTYENALEVRRLIGLSEPIYLYTSAAHMPRAVGVFKKLGFKVFPRPVDYQVLHHDLSYAQKVGWHSYRAWRIYTYELTATIFYYLTGRI